MSNTRGGNDPDVQLTAEERKKKDNQDAIERIAKANAMKVLLPPAIYTFKRIDDAAQIEKLKKEREDAGLTGDAISESPSVTTNIDDKDGTFKVSKDGKEIPNELIYVKGGVITSSVSSKDFKQEHADRMIAKALEMGKDLILNVGEKNANWSQMSPKLLKREMRVLDMMIKASNDAGQPYVLGEQARGLLRAVDVAESTKNWISKNKPTTETEEKYLNAEVKAAKNSATRELVLGADKDSRLIGHKKDIEKLPPINDSAAFKAEVAPLTDSEKVDAITKRLGALDKRAEATEGATKDIKANVDGAADLVAKIEKDGAAVFNNASDDFKQKNVKRAVEYKDKSALGKKLEGSKTKAKREAVVKGMEDPIQKAERVLENVNDKFGKTPSARSELQSDVVKENKEVKDQAAACQSMLTALEAAEEAKVKVGGARDPEMQKQIAKLQTQAKALEKRADAMGTELTDVNNKAAKIPAAVKDAKTKLETDKDQFESNIGRRPAPGR